MSENRATIKWTRNSPDFLRGRYSREHTWTFDGGVTVPASSSPAVVPAPFSNPACVDPEEAFVASLSSCHMLTFLFLAQKQGFQVDAYEDDAVGIVARGESGAMWVSTVTLNPKITFSGAKLPSSTEEEKLHEMAHKQCFIANSVKTEVTVHFQHAGEKV
ncbi:MAG TPA: OsmC family protein [Verrucomicrobiae bacterium]|nr:OsmC family protein [Verrucomicrobiae bacterium]